MAGTTPTTSTTSETPSSDAHSDGSTVVTKVFSSTYETVYTIPTDAIIHRPGEAQRGRLVICPNFSPGNSQSCKALSACPFVHADLTLGVSHLTHVNFAYPSMDRCRLPRFAPGTTLRIAAPNDPHNVICVDSSCLLKNRVFETRHGPDPGRPFVHCAHFYFSRLCELGSKCLFAHVVHLDPNARPGQRAPRPSKRSPPQATLGHHDNTKQPPRTQCVPSLHRNATPPPNTEATIRAATPTAKAPPLLSTEMRLSRPLRIPPRIAAQAKLYLMRTGMKHPSKAPRVTEARARAPSQSPPAKYAAGKNPYAAVSQLKWIPAAEDDL